MTEPDPLNARAYQLVVRNTEKSAARALKDIRRHVDHLEREGTASPVTALGEAQRLAVEVNELVRYLSALAILKDVAFLAEDDP